MKDECESGPLNSDIALDHKRSSTTPELSKLQAVCQYAFLVGERLQLWQNCRVRSFFIGVWSIGDSSVSA
jgi:hypothetical protein